MQQLTDTCIAVIGKERIRTETEINKSAEGPERLPARGQWRSGQVELFDKQGELFDEVVLTTPAYVTSELVRDMDPELSERLLAMEWSSTAIISIAFKKDDIRRSCPASVLSCPRSRTGASTQQAGVPSSGLSARLMIVCCSAHSWAAVIMKSLCLKMTRGWSASCSRNCARSRASMRSPSSPRSTGGSKACPNTRLAISNALAKVDELKVRHPGLHLIGCSYRGIGIGDCVKSGFDAAIRESPRGHEAGC